MAGWVLDDNQTPKRRNREWWTRLIATGPTFDCDNVGAINVLAKSLDGSYITTGEATHWTMNPSGTAGIGHSFTICNSHTAVNNVQLHLVPNGGSRAVSNAIFYGSLRPKETIVIGGPFFVAPSDTLRTISTGAASGQVSLIGAVTELSGGFPEGILAKTGTGTGYDVRGVALGTGFSTIYTCPVAGVEHSSVHSILACNTAVQNQEFTLALVPSGQSVSARYYLEVITLKVGEIVTIGDLLQSYVMKPGDTLQAIAVTAGVIGLRPSITEYATS